MEILVLLLLLAANTKTIAFDRTKRMLNAKKCDIKDHPSIVSITTSNYSNVNITTYKYATGVLLTLKWVLSHDRVVETEDYSDSKVVAGTNYELPSKTDQVRDIERMVQYPNFVVSLLLIELKKPFVKNDKIQPAKLPERDNFVNDCKKITLVGWGQNQRDYQIFKEVEVTKEGNKLGDTLQCAKAEHVLINCTSKDSSKFCFALEGGTELCEDDMGLGIFCNDTLVGMPSGWPNNCRPNRGEFYEALNITDRKHMKWLQQTTDIASPYTPTPITTTPGDTYRISTTIKRKQQFSTLESESPDGSTEMSNGRHLKAIPSVYPLLICLRLIL